MNNRKFFGVALSAVAFITCYVGSAKAQDQCRDVLQNGTFQTSRIRENTYFQQIIYSRFLSSTYEESKDDSALGFGIPVGDIVIGGDYTREQFNQKKQSIEQEGFKKITSNREIDVALTSGDPTIIRAWSECMKTRGGISFRFDVASPTEIFTTLEWFPIAGITQITLEEDITLPSGASISQGAGCFRKGYVLVASNSCKSVIILPDALTTYPISINTPKSSTAAYLPPRIELKKEFKNYAFQLGDDLFTEAYRKYLKPTRELKLSNEMIADGWTFDTSSARVRLEIIQANYGNYCKNEFQKVNLYTFTYGFEIEGKQKTPERNYSVKCKVIPSVMLIRERWIPIGSLTSTK